MGLKAQGPSCPLHVERGLLFQAHLPYLGTGDFWWQHWWLLHTLYTGSWLFPLASYVAPIKDDSCALVAGGLLPTLDPWNGGIKPLGWKWHSGKLDITITQKPRCEIRRWSGHASKFHFVYHGVSRDGESIVWHTDITSGFLSRCEIMHHQMLFPPIALP